MTSPESRNLESVKISFGTQSKCGSDNEDYTCSVKYYDSTFKLVDYSIDRLVFTLGKVLVALTKDDVRAKGGR